MFFTIPLGIFLDPVDTFGYSVFANGAKAAEHDPRVRVGARLEPARHRPARDCPKHAAVNSGAVGLSELAERR